MAQWKVNLYILWVSQVIALTSFGLGTPFVPFYIQELGVTDPVQLKLYTGILSAAPAVTMAFMSPVWGILSDRYGRKLMIQRAMITASVILFLIGSVNAVWQMVVLRILQGIFTGTATAAAAFIGSNTPDNRMSYALGVISSSTFVGYSFGPLIGGVVAEHYGYRVSYFIGALLLAIGFLLVTIKLVEDKSTLIKIRKKGEKKGKLTDVLTPTISVLLIMLFMQRVTRSVFTPFLPLFIQDQLATSEGASSITGYISGVTGFLTAFSAIFISKLGDRTDKIKLIQILLFLGVIDAAALKFLGGWVAFIITYCLLFFIVGGIEPLMTSMSAQKVPYDQRGLLFGIQGFIGSIGWLVSPTLGTYISIRFGITEVLWVVLATVTINFCFIYFVKHRQRTS